MTEPAMITNVLTTLASLFVLWFLVFWMYADFELEWYRQKMFSIRDSLFDYARETGLPFEDPAYVLLRQTMNGFIRFGDRVGFISTLLLAWNRDEEEIDLLRARWAAPYANLSPARRETLQHYEHRMHEAVTQHIILGSGMVLLIFPVAVGFAVMKSGEQVIASLAAAIKRREVFYT